MCCRKNKRAAHGRLNPQLGHLNASLLTGTMGPMIARGFGNNDTPIAPVNNITPARAIPEKDPLTFSSAIPIHPDEYKQSDNVPAYAPPSYDHATGNPLPEVATREMTSSTYTPKVELPAQYHSSHPGITRLIEGLTAAMLAHQAGSGRERNVRRAEKALRNEIYEVEVARRKSMYGRLRCGEKSEIWREVKDINFGY